MSRLLDFYRGVSPDTQRRLLAEILVWDDEALEEVHDFIQWLFPLPEPSNYNPHAPLLTREDIAAFRSEPVLQANLHQSFARILSFLGLALAEDGSVIEGPHFSERRHEVWTSPNHNWLRISRILRSLTLLGGTSQAQALYTWLKEQYQSRKSPIGLDTFAYWTKAVHSAQWT